MSKALASHVASIRNIHPSLKTLLLLPAINPHLSLSHLQFDRSVIVPIFNLKTRAHYPSHFAPSVQQMSLNRSTLYYLLVFIISVRALIAVVVIAIIIGGIVGIQLQRTSYLNRSMGSLSVIVSNYTYMQRCPPDCNQTGEESTRQVLSAVPAPRYRGMVTWPGLPGTGACCLWCFFFFLAKWLALVFSWPPSAPKENCPYYRKPTQYVAIAMALAENDVWDVEARIQKLKKSERLTRYCDQVQWLYTVNRHHTVVGPGYSHKVVAQSTSCVWHQLKVRKQKLLEWGIEANITLVFYQIVCPLLLNFRKHWIITIVILEHSFHLYCWRSEEFAKRRAIHTIQLPKHNKPWKIIKQKTLGPNTLLSLALVPSI